MRMPTMAPRLPMPDSRCYHRLSRRRQRITPTSPTGLPNSSHARPHRHRAYPTSNHHHGRNVRCHHVLAAHMFAPWRASSRFLPELK